jgi:hypothetical protein
MGIEDWADALGREAEAVDEEPGRLAISRWPDAEYDPDGADAQASERCPLVCVGAGAAAT